MTLLDAALDYARANWFADQLAIALARLVKRERETPCE